MSHISTIKCQIKNLRALKRAVERLNGTFHEDKKDFQWTYGPRQKCDHAISFPNTRQEIGVIQTGDHYELKCDYYGGLYNIIGQDAGKLMDHYNMEVAIEEAMALEYPCSETKEKDGSLTLEVLVMEF